MASELQNSVFRFMTSLHSSKFDSNSVNVGPLWLNFRHGVAYNVLCRKLCLLIILDEVLLRKIARYRGLSS